MVFERAEVFPTTEDLRPTARPRARPTDSRSSRARCTAGPARRARRALHDLPPVQRLRAGRAARRRARHRARGARPDPQGADRPQPAADLRLGRADPHAHPRRRHRRRHRDRDGEPGRRERGLQHLGVRGTHGGGDRADRVGGLRQGRRGSSSSTCRASRSTCPAAGPRSRRRAGCWAGRRGSASRGDREHRGVAARAACRAPGAPRRSSRAAGLRRPPPLPLLGRRRWRRRAELDLLDPAAVRAAVGRGAASSSTWRRWRRGALLENPQAALDENIEMTLNLLEAVRLEAPEAAVVLAGSGEVYGPPERLPSTSRRRFDRRAPTRLRRRPATARRPVRRQPRPARRPHAGLQPRRPGPDRRLPGRHAHPPGGRGRGRRRREVVLRPATRTRPATSLTYATLCALTWRPRTSSPGSTTSAAAAPLSVRELVELVRAAARLPVRHEVDPAGSGHDVAEVRGSVDRLRAAAGWERDPARADGGGRAGRVALAGRRRRRMNSAR